MAPADKLGESRDGALTDWSTPARARAAADHGLAHQRAIDCLGEAATSALGGSARTTCRGSVAPGRGIKRGAN
ncbi:hypothetical protein GCM10010246_85110 [Streptomyces cuspidosporus]|uniref:Uncharacterized protein n=1 Tax=Streptomyces cuspidosporus TaxID=66882 RepID=A0ABP5UI02_9ACTN